MLRVNRLSGLAIVALVSLTASTFAAPAAPQEEEGASAALRAARGRTTYRVYCRNCHGKTGLGDGPIAELLKVPPADLTRITARRGGTFPSQQIYDVIDGRQEVKGHGSRDMPIWGVAFRDVDRETDQEEEVRDKILDLVAFLESLQAGE